MDTKIFIKKIQALVIGLVFLIGCSEDFLNLDSPTQVTTLKFWQTPTDLEQGIAATYKMLSEESDGSYYMRTNPQLTEGKTENFTVSTDVTGRYEIGSYVNTMSNNNSYQVFRAQYRGIFRANQVLHYAPQIQNISEDLRNIVIGEAKFLRGLYYFHLVNEFGAVPMTTEIAQSSDDYFKDKATEEEVWAQIISDWDDAESKLPVNWESKWAGRATRGAAIAFKGRAYLYQAKWNEAITEYEKIQNNLATYGYDLLDNYEQLWDGKHENSKESIFEVQYSRIKADVWGGRTASSTVYPQEVCSNEAGGWEEILPTKTLLEAMTKELTATGGFDPRATATIAWNYPGCIYYTMKFDSLYSKEELETGKPVIHNRKLCNHWNRDEGDWRSELNEIPMRYADVLLGLAEAYTMTNQVGKAAPLVHKIRTRAKLTDKLATMTTWNQTQMMEEIRHQRNMEFTREFVHFFDLRRWGILEQTIQASKKLGWANFRKRNEYYPLPELELNANPKLEQNPDWM